MKIEVLVPIFLTAAFLCSCQKAKENQERKQNEMENFDRGTFGYDLNFLKLKDSVIVLENKVGNGRVIISPKYQGKVFTSTADGQRGKSFGWINYEAFDGPADPHMNAYGVKTGYGLGRKEGSSHCSLSLEQRCFSRTGEPLMLSTRKAGTLFLLTIEKCPSIKKWT